MSVVDFPRRETGDPVWVCNCGSTTHYHKACGDVECASCRNIASGLTGHWRERLPDVGDDIGPLDMETFKVIDMDDAGVFLRRQIKTAGNAAVVVIINDDGSPRTWTKSDVLAGTPAAHWIMDRLVAAHERLTRRA